MTHDFRSLVAMLRYRALHQGNRRAYTFLVDGETENAALTYGQLDRGARAIAATLADRGARPGDRAILLYPPGLDFITAFFGAIYAGVIAVPCYPPHRSQLARSLPRLKAIIANAEPSVVLCPAGVAALSAWVAHVPALGALPWIATDSLGDDAATSWKEPDAGPSTLAFLQYTSGSTAAPRAVMVTHGNLLHNLAVANHVEENDDDSISVSWLPVIHDMGLIEGVLEPAYAGYPAYLMAPATFLQRPISWLRAISKYRATNSGGPNFAYDLCTRKIRAEQRDTLDLSSWRVAYNGAEPIRRDTLTAFNKAFRDCGFDWKSFYPVYGLAESTLVVTSGRRSYEPVFLDADAAALRDGKIEEASPVGSGRRVSLVSSGPPAFGSRVLIVNPDTCRRCAPREIGEIWLSSPSVAKGYWRREEETLQTFGAMLADDGSGPYLRTGDLGALIDGELFVAGRLKDLLIVRGFKHYPQDLELTVERQHPAIRPGCAAVFALEAHDDERIAVAAEVDPRRLEIARMNPPEFPDAPFRLREGARAISELIGTIRRAVAEIHGVQLHTIALLRPGAIPKTSSGKIRHRDCAQALSGGQLAEIVRWVQPDVGPADSRAVLLTSEI
ncbi:MAG TPA: fatty acyl-AMP ligase [Pyrinomonadaceae bacterium]|nr:fatty acyl-AMP ligase [Pyrinomonadaceae bacterium]